MASRQLTIVVRPRGNPIKGLPEEVTISNLDNTKELHQKIAKAARFSPHRLRITKGSDGSHVPNAQNVTVDRVGLRDRSVVNVKDLGPQISWRLVFIIEYLGPLLIHPLIFSLRNLIYGTDFKASKMQEISLVMLTFHFLKREIETVFIHRFSSATMPAFNIFKNSGHYWIFAGLNIAYWVYSPISSAALSQNEQFLAPALGLFAIGELGNLYTHFVLMNLRTPGTTERGIPEGFGFNLVTCPNYMFETIAWVGMALATWSWSTLIFVLLAVGQMALWAKKKENRYRKEFGDKYRRKRYAILPGIY